MSLREHKFIIEYRDKSNMVDENKIKHLITYQLEDESISDKDFWEAIVDYTIYFISDKIHDFLIDELDYFQDRVDMLDIGMKDFEKVITVIMACIEESNGKDLIVLQGELSFEDYDLEDGSIENRQYLKEIAIEYIKTQKSNQREHRNKYEMPTWLSVVVEDNYDVYRGIAL